MPILVACSCGKKLRVKDELAGKRIKCPACATPLTVPSPVEEEPVVLEVEPATRSKKAAPPETRRPSFWVDPNALGGKIIGLSDDTIFLYEVSEKKKFERTQRALEDGTAVEDALADSETIIPLEEVKKVESNLHLRFLDVTWQDRKAGKETETNVLCPTKESRDEMVDGLQDRLGPDWKRQVEEYNRLKASWQPLVVLAIFGFITFCFIMAARNPDSGDGGTRTVRTNWLGAIFAWVFNLFGPVGAALLGTPFILGGIAWFVMRMLKPPIVLTLSPRHSIRAN